MSTPTGLTARNSLPLLGIGIGASLAMAAIPAAGQPETNRLLPIQAAAAQAALTEPATVQAAVVPQVLTAPALVQDDDQVTAATTPTIATPDGVLDARQVECVAKTIIHEAGGEPHIGQVAVAQVIRARVKSGRFAADPCAVVKQRGQFFDVDSYNPSRADARWSNAVAIATETLAGSDGDVAPGALYFHAVSSHGGWMGGNRVRVTQIGGHVFYR